MKYYKRISLDPHNPTTDRWAYEADGRIITTSTNSLELPKGTKLQRPSSVVNGQIRYSTTLKNIEARIDNLWEIIRTVTPANLAVQQLGNGNNHQTTFGPLNPDYSRSYAAGPANVMVYIDNVYQIPGVNYTIGSASTVTSSLSQVAAVGTSTLHLADLTNIVAGQTVSGSAYIPLGTTVTSVSTVTDAIGISHPTSGAISSGTSLTFSFSSSGSYINFNGTVPFKPVVAILGMDGNFPPAA